jgi:hypothetical protein
LDRTRNEQAEFANKFGFKVLHQLSNTDITVSSNNNVLFIAHRGTDASLKSSYSLHDVATDLGIAKGKNLPMMRIRTEQTVDIIQKLKNDTNTANMHIILTGHSLGGHTALFSMHTEETIYNHVSKCHVFNPAIHHLAELYEINSTAANKTVIHRTHNDKVSEGINTRKLYGPLPGRLIEYKGSVRGAANLVIGEHSLEIWFNELAKICGGEIKCDNTSKGKFNNLISGFNK